MHPSITKSFTFEEVKEYIDEKIKLGETIEKRDPEKEKEVQKNKGIKDVDIIVLKAREQGWEVDMEALNRGSCFLYLRDLNKRSLQLTINVTNGHFFVYKPFTDKVIATHLSTKYDKEEWYNEILNLIYIDRGENIG